MSGSLGSTEIKVLARNILTGAALDLWEYDRIELTIGHRTLVVSVKQDGRAIEIHTLHGRIVISPKSSNLIEIPI